MTRTLDEIEEVLGAAEAVIEDGEIDLEDVTTPEKVKVAQLELIAHLRDQLCSEKENPIPPWVVIAWIYDRREQYRPSTSTYEGLSQILAGLGRRDHVAAWKHGELDDLRKEAERILRGLKRSSVRVQLNAAVSEATPEQPIALVSRLLSQLWLDGKRARCPYYWNEYARRCVLDNNHDGDDHVYAQPSKEKS